jgi:Zn-dependent M16 (insulinase) family peptidase
MNPNFTVTQDRTISEINSRAKLLIHNKTGARVLSITNNDENKCFGISFRTPPGDSTGIAHIMEHSVLCGSRKYPVKEPFVEILKGSLQTFVNAFTYPDKTCYPCASQNLKDFYNLVDIYLDSVFYPLIPEHTFRQEGWHYELASPESPLTYKGVVFNEMKGAYSSPDDLLDDKSRSSLFPDNTYAFDSGGDPLVMPNLTYEAFKSFHDTYYHPSNAYIFFYGDDPDEERLRILETVLGEFEKKVIPSNVPLQKKFIVPKKMTFPYDSGDSPKGKSHLTVNWMLAESIENENTLQLALLGHILLGTPASPLKKALIESGLGEDVTGGYSDHLRQTIFSAGLKGIQHENLEKVEALILDTITDLARNGIDPQTVAASINTIEFHLREQNTGRFPRGLSIMLGALKTWLFDGDPLGDLAFEEPLAALKEKLKTGHLFETLIETYLLQNTHRTTVMLIPDPGEGKRRENVEKERLEKAQAGMTADELEKIISLAADLKRRQDTPDSPEALATIPSLSLADIDRSTKNLPTESLKIGTTPLLVHDLFTNGIVYLDLGFDLHSLPEDLLPYAGLLGRMLLEMGTEKEDFVKLTQRIGRNTGGIRSASLNSAIRGSERSATWFFLRGKTVAAQAGELLEIIKDILLSAHLDQRDRFRQIALERKAGLEASLVPGGSSVVNQRLRARFNEADWVSEQMHGVAHLFFLRVLIDSIDNDWNSVLEKLETLRGLIINRSTMIANVTLDAANWNNFKPLLAGFLESLPDNGSATIRSQPRPVYDDQPQQNEGLTIPAQVNYVAKGVNIYKHGYKLHGSVQVINNYLQTTWLWEKIRVQGGAYGGHSAFDIHSGVFNFYSYRDPNLLATLNNFDATAGFLRSLEISESELTKSIIGTIGDLDAYLLPDAKGWTAMVRSLLEYNDELRQQFRDQVLSTRLNEFHSFGEILAEVASSGQVVVLGSALAIEKANQEQPGMLEVLKVL